MGPHDAVAVTDMYYQLGQRSRMQDILDSQGISHAIDKHEIGRAITHL